MPASTGRETPNHLSALCGSVSDLELLSTITTTTTYIYLYNIQSIVRVLVAIQTVHLSGDYTYIYARSTLPHTTVTTSYTYLRNSR